MAISLLFCRCRGTELNRRHEDFQSSALPTELPRHGRKIKRLRLQDAVADAHCCENCWDFVPTPALAYARPVACDRWKDACTVESSQSSCVPTTLSRWEEPHRA